MRIRSLPAIAVLLLMGTAPLLAQGPVGVDSAFLAAFKWRSIGPANMAGRVTDIAGIPSPSKTFFVAGATGGIWKTTNDGITFRPVFDHEPVVSMGALAIAPSDTMQVWAGTGEEDSRNSISPGGGIYKSTDGGLTWTDMGLDNTGAIGRIVVDPRNPDVVYVAALGHAWGANPERGVYKTTDGGKTWKLVKFVSDKAGFVDIAMNPSNPDELLASAWQRVRGPYFLNSGGPDDGLWRTTDAGATWTEVKGGGFPSTMKGRIGIAYSMSNPQVVYALVEAEKDKAGKGGSGLYRSQDDGHTWTMMNDQDTRPFYYSQVRVDPSNPDRVYWSSTPFRFSDDGGKTVRNGTIGIHVDDHAMWIDPKDPEHFLVGDDGGAWQTWDRGGNFEYLNTIPMGQFYDVSYDMAIPYHVCGGLQDNGSWCGPTRKERGSITNYDWATVAGGDGFYTAQDQTDPNTVYAESQNGGIVRVNMTTGETDRLRKPDYADRYRQWEDSLVVVRGDTTKPETGAMKRHLAELRRHQVADSAATDLRYNWETPLFLSPHDQHTLYVGANKVLKSTAQGDDLQIISPDLTTDDTAKINVSLHTTGGITTDVTGAENYGTIVSLAESPVTQGLLYAGTDDGNVWTSPDDGGHWVNLTSKLTGVPPGTYVSKIEPSPFDANTFFVAFDNHERDDFKPYLFVTTDGGQTFHSIAAGLPSGGPQDYVHVIRQDPVNPDLLFVGTDIAAYVSLDRGASWHRFARNLPSVPVRDLKIQPRDHELIAGTHGRAIWIVGIAPLEQLKTQTLAGPALFQPAPGLEFGDAPLGGESLGQQAFQGQSPEYGAQIQYFLPGSAVAQAEPSGDGDGGSRAGGFRQGRGRGPMAHVAILNASGDTVQTLTGPATAGLHEVTWNLRPKPEPRKALSPAQRRDSAITSVKLKVIADSLINSGMDRRTVERMVGILEGRGGRFGGFFRGGQRENISGEPFVDRPAESPPPRAGAAPAGGEFDYSLLRSIREELRKAGVRTMGGFRGGFGRGGSQVAPGDYTVSITLDGRTMTEKLTVLRAPGFGAANSGEGGDTDSDGGW